MERLSTLDAAFLDAEDGDPRVSMGIASAIVLAGPAPTQEEFVTALRMKLPHIPRYRQRLVRVPFDLHRPVWVDDPDFDINYHVRRTALPAPGGDDELAALMGRVMTHRLDRDRPLWEYWVVEGLADDHWAVISKLHHSIADGVAGNQLYEVVCDGAIAGVDEPWHPGPFPSRRRLITDAVLELAFDPLEQLRIAAGYARDPSALLRRISTTAQGLAALASATLPATRSSLSGSIGHPRRYAFARGSLTDMRAAKARYGCTINDLALAAISGAFRQLLLARGERPDPHAIRSLVPVSVRPPDVFGSYDNRVSLLLPYLPVHIADPVQRLAAVHRELVDVKASHEAEAGETVSHLADHEPFAPLSRALRAAFAFPQHSITTVTTNVPGPRTPLTMLGRPLLEMFPYVPIATTMRSGISISTYCDRITFGITADYDTMPDVATLATALETELATLTKDPG